MQRTLIAIPCGDMVHTDFMASLRALKVPDGTEFTIVKNTLIHVARSRIAANAIEAEFDRVMWFDSDMRFAPDTMLRLSEDMDKSGCGFVTGLYFTRRQPITPVIYSYLAWERRENEIYAAAQDYRDYPEGLIEIAGSGFGCCLTSVDLLRRVGDKFGAPFAHLHGLGEDLSFCHRVIQLGEKMLCDTSVKCGHIGMMEFGEDHFLRQ